MTQISEAFRQPNTWHYQDSVFSAAKDSPEDVKEDIADLQDLSTQWRKEKADKKAKIAQELHAQQSREERDQRAVEYTGKLQQERDAFLRSGVSLAKSKNQSEIQETIVKIRKELHLLEPHDHFDQLYEHELKLLEEVLTKRLEKVAIYTELRNKLNVRRWEQEIKNYLRRNRKVSVKGENEPKPQLFVETSVSHEEDLELLQQDTEFEASFIQVTVDHTLENETSYQRLIVPAITEASNNAIRRKLISNDALEAAMKASSEPNAEFTAWSSDKNRDKAEIRQVDMSMNRFALEQAMDGILLRMKLDPKFEDILPEELKTQLTETKDNAISLQPLHISAELIDIALFSSKDFTQFVRDLLNRPDIKNVIRSKINEKSTEEWEAFTSEEKKAQGPFAQYLKKKNDEFEENLKNEKLWNYPPMILDSLGVDLDLLAQVLSARHKNQGQAFATELQASQALLGEKGTQWWHDIQTMEAAEPFLTPLTQREVLISDDALVLPPPPIPGELTRREKRMNFVHALHLKVGLDTPSKFVDYDKANEIVITQHSEQCIQMLNQLLLVRGELQSDDYQEQLEHFKKNSELIHHNMSKFAQSYMRLNQALGDITGRSMDETSPARQFLTEIYVGGAEKGSRGKHLGALVAFLDFGLADWLKENKAPHETIFEPKENEQERMS